MEPINKRWRLRWTHCLICGVDSGPIRNFLILTIGSLVAMTVCFGIWSWATGRLKQDASSARLALEAEEGNFHDESK